MHITATSAVTDTDTDADTETIPNERWREAANAAVADDHGIDIEPYGEVSPSDEGAWVQAWVWVPLHHVTKD